MGEARSQATAASGIEDFFVHSVLVYGDSMTWGIIPDTRKRFSFDERWPGVLENQLRDSGKNVRVIEDCLNGRRTVWEDPFKPGRNGRQGLAQRIEIHSPLSLVIVMLGTNDFQFAHPQNNAWSAAHGVAALVNDIRNAPIEPGMPDRHRAVGALSEQRMLASANPFQARLFRLRPMDLALP